MKKEFDVYFREANGGLNHKILEATNIFDVMLYLVDLGIMNDVEKIERR